MGVFTVITAWELASGRYPSLGGLEVLERARDGPLRQAGEHPIATLQIQPLVLACSTSCSGRFRPSIVSTVEAMSGSVPLIELSLPLTGVPHGRRRAA